MKSSVLKTAVKLLVLGVLCCAPLPLSAENNPHLVAPKSIDFGLCPRGGEMPVSYSKVFTLANNSDEDLYVVHTMILPDYSRDKYQAYGIMGSVYFIYNRPGLGSPPTVIPAKKSIQLGIWFFSEDTKAVGDTGAVTFDWKLVLQSRTSPEFPRHYVDLYNDTINLHAVAVDSQKISGSHLIYYSANGCTAVFKNRVLSHYGVGFSNTLPEAVVLDSLISLNDGPPKPEFFYPVDRDGYSKIPLPLEIPSGGMAAINAYLERSGVGEDRIAFTGHFTGKDSKKHYTAQAVVEIKDTVLREARFWSSATFFQSDDGLPEVKYEQVYLAGCSPETVWVDSVVVTKDWQPGEVRVALGAVPFPFVMEPDKNYRLDITYTPKTRGRQFGFIKAYFHTNDGRQIVRTLDFQTYFPDSVSSVGEIREDNHATPSLLITEPNLPLKLLGAYLDTPKLYDSYGNFIDLSARLEQDYISLEGLSSGVYCFVFKTPVGMVSRKVLYVR